RAFFAGCSCPESPTADQLTPTAVISASLRAILPNEPRWLCRVEQIRVGPEDDLTEGRPGVGPLRHTGGIQQATKTYLGSISASLDNSCLLAGGGSRGALQSGSLVHQIDNSTTPYRWSWVSSLAKAEGLFLSARIVTDCRARVSAT